jgi:hypothetical protein
VLGLPGGNGRAMIGTGRGKVKRTGKILGYVLVVAGAAAIFVGVSPLFPVFLEAFVVGGVLIAGGLWVLAGPDLRASLRRAARLRATGRSAARRLAPRVIIDPLLPVRILKLAKERGGILTVAEVAIELTVPLDHAEAGLSECVRAGNALPDYDVARAHAYYRFPEFGG